VFSTPRVSLSFCLPLALALALALLLGSGLPAPAAAPWHDPADRPWLERLVGHLARVNPARLWPALDAGLTDAVVSLPSGSYRVRPRMGTPVDRIGGVAVPGLPTLRALPGVTVDREQLATDRPWDVREIEGRPVHLLRLQTRSAGAVDEALVAWMVGLFRYETQAAFRLTRPTDLGSGWLDDQDRALSQLEAEVLDRLLGEPEGLGMRARQGAALFVALRKRHEESLPPRAADHMLSMTILEGTARYLDTLVRQRVLKDGQAIARLRAELRAQLPGDERRFGLVGAAEAFVLDRWDPDWNRRFEQPIGSLEEVLAAVPALAGETDGAAYLGGQDAVESRLEQLERAPVPARSPGRLASPSARP